MVTHVFNLRGMKNFRRALGAPTRNMASTRRETRDRVGEERMPQSNFCWDENRETWISIKRTGALFQQSSRFSLRSIESLVHDVYGPCNVCLKEKKARIIALPCDSACMMWFKRCCHVTTCLQFYSPRKFVQSNDGSRNDIVQAAATGNRCASRLLRMTFGRKFHVKK